MRLTIAYSKIKKAKSSVGLLGCISKRNLNEVTRSAALKATFSRLLNIKLNLCLTLVYTYSLFYTVLSYLCFFVLFCFVLVFFVFFLYCFSFVLF